MVLPSANLQNLVVQSSETETLIYNLSTHQAFCLNDTLTKVFDSCDGKTSFDELKRKHKFTDDLIYLALDELKSKNLLENYQDNHFGNLSRREVIKRVGLATMFALPIVVGISAPLAAQAQSLDVCLANNCANGNAACNPGGGCGALGANFVCCFALNSCNCVTVATCNFYNGSFCA